MDRLIQHVVLLAAESPGAGGTGNPVELLVPYLNLGVIVVLVIMVVTRTGVVPKWAIDDAKTTYDASLTTIKEGHDRELAAKDAIISSLQADKTELKADNDRLATTMLRDTIPALTEANRLTAQWVEIQNRRAFEGGRTPT